MCFMLITFVIIFVFRQYCVLLLLNITKPVKPVKSGILVTNIW